MPIDSRPVLGWMFSRGRDHSLNAPGDHLGMDARGRLLFSDGEKTYHGKTAIKRWTWRQAAMVRKGEKAKIYIDGKLEVEATLKTGSIVEDFFIGGRNDNQTNWEGRLDEVALFDRSLSAGEIRKLLP